jgi:iron(III) transport system permease protein
VVLPQLRPAILGGALLAFLYTVSEFGAVQLLGFDTLTRVIFATRLSDRALSFACATVVLVLALGVITLERWQRGPAAPDRRSSTDRTRVARLGWRAVPATALCSVVAATGLFVPIASLATWAERGIADGRVHIGDLVGPTVGTAIVSIVAALLAVTVVLPIAIASTRRPHVTSRVASVAVVGGFAVPGLVIALSLAALALATPILNRWYQTFALLIVAYVIHFGSQALSSSETAVRAVPDAVRESSRLLESRSWWRALRVDLPLMRPGLVAGGGLVLLSTLKELPATLLLAPIGFSTLATRIWSSYGEGFYAATGLASLVLIAVSAVLTWALVLRHSDAMSS